MMKRLISCLLATVALLVGCGSNTTMTPVPETPSATSAVWYVEVNGDGVTRVEFEAELARYQAAQAGLGNQVSQQDAAQWVLDDLVNQMLLVQGAGDEGFTVDDAMLQARIEDLAGKVEGLSKLESWMAENGYSEESFRRSLSRAIAAAWMRDQIVASVPRTAEQVHVRQILLYNLEEAQSTLAQLNAGEDFEALAFSADPITQGELGWFPRGYLPEKAVEDSAFSLQPDQYSNVVETSIGFHILFLIERDPERLLSPDALLALQNLALKEWLVQRRAQSAIAVTP